MASKNRRYDYRGRLLATPEYREHLIERGVPEKVAHLADYNDRVTALIDKDPVWRAFFRHQLEQGHNIYKGSRGSGAD